jgi:tetratricopeptide (TPR) repeat protein
VARKRLSRRELVEKDEITTGLESATGYVVAHAKTIGIVVGVAVLAAAIVVGMRVTAANRTAEAEEALAEVIQLYLRIDENTTDEERFEATLAAAARVQVDYPDQPAAQIARYYEALGHKEMGNIDQSVSILADLSESGGLTINAMARFALAELYKEQGDLDLAVESFQALGDSGGFPREAVLYELGRIHEELAMPDEARDYYQTLVGEFPDSAFRSEADRALRRLAPSDTGEDS